jgi:hypothetical protein
VTEHVRLGKSRVAVVLTTRPRGPARHWSQPGTPQRRGQQGTGEDERVRFIVDIAAGELDSVPAIAERLAGWSVHR